MHFNEKIIFSKPPDLGPVSNGPSGGVPSSRYPATMNSSSVPPVSTHATRAACAPCPASTPASTATTHAAATARAPSPCSVRWRSKTKAQQRLNSVFTESPRLQPSSSAEGPDQTCIRSWFC